MRSKGCCSKSEEKKQNDLQRVRLQLSSVTESQNEPPERVGDRFADGTILQHAHFEAAVGRHHRALSFGRAGGKPDGASSAAVYFAKCSELHAETSRDATLELLLRLLLRGAVRANADVRSSSSKNKIAGFTPVQARGDALAREKLRKAEGCFVEGHWCGGHGERFGAPIVSLLC